MGLLMLCACAPAEQIQDTSITPAKLRVAVASNFYPTLSTLLTQHTLLNEQITPNPRFNWHIVCTDNTWSAL